MQVAIENDSFVVDMELVANLLDLSVEDVPALMRAGRITSVCERGSDQDLGRYRLNFFYGRRRARVNVDATGRILGRSSVDFGEQSMPASPCRSTSHHRIRRNRS